MQIRQIYQIDNNQLLIEIPPSFDLKKKVLVTLEQVDDVLEKKLKLMKYAKTDKLFLEDVNEITKDFENLDLS